MTGSTLIEQPRTTFSSKGVREVQHLQAALRECIDALTPEKGDLMVLSTEYTNWEDSQRRIDLLAVDRSGALVVIELKRTEDAGHAELQALRYAAMVSQLTFDEGVLALIEHRNRQGTPELAESAEDDLVAFLSRDEAEEVDPRTVFGHRVRIILAAADFSREVTGTVLWLRDNSDLDIRCVRLTPYDVDGVLHIYSEQVIPLPEAEDYRVRKALRERSERAALRRQRGIMRGTYMVWSRDSLITPTPVSRRRAFAMVVRSLVDAGEAPESVARYLDNPKLWYRVDGAASPDELRDQIRRLFPSDRQKVSRYDLHTESLIQYQGGTYALYNQDSARQLPALSEFAARHSIRWEEVPAEANDDA